MSVKKGLVRRIETDTFRLTFVPDNKGVELYKIEVFENGKGLGTKLMMFMEQIVENLHEMKNMKGTIVLRPAGFGNTPTEVLRKWYNKLGYKRPGVTWDVIDCSSVTPRLARKYRHVII